jgi:hypothetical protein
MLIYHKTSETTVNLIEVMLGFDRSEVKLFRNLTINSRWEKHKVLLNDLEIGKVLVTGCTAVGFDYNGTVRNYDFFERYLPEKRLTF